MAPVRHCRACGEAFTPDPRNQHRQAFCALPDCQRQRRAAVQRRRRQKEASLTRSLRPSDAAWLKKNPLIIGLISVLIESRDLAEIEAYCSTLIERGTQILNEHRTSGSPKTVNGK